MRCISRLLPIATFAMLCTVPVANATSATIQPASIGLTAVKQALEDFSRIQHFASFRVSSVEVNDTALVMPHRTPSSYQNIAAVAASAQKQYTVVASTERGTVTVTITSQKNKSRVLNFTINP